MPMDLVFVLKWVKSVIGCTKSYSKVEQMGTLNFCLHVHCLPKLPDDIDGWNFVCLPVHDVMDETAHFMLAKIKRTCSFYLTRWLWGKHRGFLEWRWASLFISLWISNSALKSGSFSIEIDSNSKWYSCLYEFFKLKISPK